jgi:SAM-dependent methyltransferase
MNAYRRLASSIRTHGWRGTASLALKKAGAYASLIGDQWFDYKYGTGTVEIIELNRLDISSENKPFGMRYEVTRARPFRRLLRELALPRDSVFVDFGSGKGRVLMLAAEYGFRKVIGVEFSAELCDAARRNLEVFAAKQELEMNFEIVEDDVVDYEIQPDQTVFFMFNPFYTVVLESVLENIARSLDKHPRKICLIYQYPECRSTIDGYGLFFQTARYEWGGCEFIIYENRD